MLVLQKIKRVNDQLTNRLADISGIAVFITMILVTYGALSRYLFNKGVFFTEDIAALLLVVNFSFAFAYVFKEGLHVKITLILNKLPLKIRRYVEVANGLVVLAFLIILSKESISFTVLGFQLSNRSLSADIYLPPWMAMLSLGLVMFTVNVLIHCVGKIGDIVVKKQPGKEEVKIGEA